jgi:hypothetical protein
MDFSRLFFLYNLEFIMKLLNRFKLLLVLSMFVPALAHAKLSEIFGNIAVEAGSITQYLLYFLSLGGLVGFVWAFVKFRKAKDENRDTGPAMVSMLVCVVLGIGSFLYAAAAESVTDEEYEVKTEYNDSDWN